MPRRFSYTFGIGQPGEQNLHLGDDTCRDGAFGIIAEDVYHRLFPHGSWWSIGTKERLEKLMGAAKQPLWAHIMVRRPSKLPKGVGFATIPDRVLSIVSGCSWFMPSAQIAATVDKPTRTNSDGILTPNCRAYDAFILQSTLEDFAHLFYTAVLVVRVCYTVAQTDNEELLGLLDGSNPSLRGNFFNYSDKRAMLDYYRSVYNTGTRINDAVSFATRYGIVQVSNTVWAKAEYRTTYARSNDDL